MSGFPRGDATERLKAVLGSQSPAELCDALADPSPEVARAAITRLVELEDRRAAEPLRARLLDADLSLVADIATALRGLDDDRAVELAIAALTENPYVRRLSAARALGALADTQSSPALHRALEDEIAGVRIAAMAALVAMGKSTEADCVRLLADPDAEVRIAAVRAVGRTATRSSSILSTVARDQDKRVRLEVARYLASLPEQAASALLVDTDVRVRETAARSAGTRQVAALLDLLARDPNGDVRRAAAQTLGGLGDRRAADGLVDGLEDRDSLVRAASLRALLRLVSRAGAVRRLRRGLLSDHAARRRAMVYALAHLDASEAASDLAMLVDDPDSDVRLAVLQAARSLLADPGDLIAQLAADHDPAVASSAEALLLRSARAHPRPIG